MYLLDTNVISELRRARSNKADKHVVAWASSVPADSMYISSITVLELELGVLQIEHRDSKQGKLLRHWLDEQVLTTFGNRIIPVDEVVAIRCAKLHYPDPKSERDALIAATALVHEQTLVTRNISDFKITNLRLINPWTEG